MPDGTIVFVALAGVKLNASPLQTIFVILLIDALGFTVTITLKDEPRQDPDFGVTV